MGRNFSPLGMKSVGIVSRRRVTCGGRLAFAMEMKTLAMKDCRGSHEDKNNGRSSSRLQPVRDGALSLALRRHALNTSWRAMCVGGVEVGMSSGGGSWDSGKSFLTRSMSGTVIGFGGSWSAFANARRLSKPIMCGSVSRFAVWVGAGERPTGVRKECKVWMR